MTLAFISSCQTWLSDLSFHLISPLYKSTHTHTDNRCLIVKWMYLCVYSLILNCEKLICHQVRNQNIDQGNSDKRATNQCSKTRNLNWNMTIIDRHLTHHLLVWIVSEATIVNVSIVIGWFAFWSPLQHDFYTWKVISDIVGTRHNYFESKDLFMK